MLACVEANRKDGKGITGDEYAVLVTHKDDEIPGLGQLYRDRADAYQPAGRRAVAVLSMVRDAAPPHRMPLMNPRTSGAGAVSPRTTCIAANWPPGAWCWPTTAGSPCETTGGACSCAWRIPTRGDHAPTVVDVHGRMQDRACGANDDHAHGTACLFREGTGSADACLCLAPKLGGPSCGAADPDHHLASRLQSFQAPPRCHRPTSSASIPRKPCEWIRLTEVFSH